MEITCPRCHSLHEIEPPPSARARGPRSLKFRCSHCGHTFSVTPEAVPESPTLVAPAPPAPPPPLSTEPPGESVGLVQIAGQIWSVPDVAALHRWILERRLDRDSLVSDQGLRWSRAGDREDLAVFFNAADALSFQARNLRTEIPALEEEIVVDASEADGDDHGGMPVSTGPGPGGRGAFDTVVMDFEPREDTQEQTVATNDLDETPVGGVPDAFDPVETVAERTERMALPAGASVRGIPVPLGLSTVNPGPAPAGSAALGLPVTTSSGPAVVAPLLIAPVPARTGAPGPAPSTLVPPPHASQSFFLDGSPASGAPPRADIFDDHPETASKTNWVLWGGLAAFVAIAIGVFALVGRQEKPEKPSAWKPPATAEAARGPDPSTAPGTPGTVPAGATATASLPAAVDPGTRSAAAPGTPAALTPAAAPATAPAAVSARTSPPSARTRAAEVRGASAGSASAEPRTTAPPREPPAASGGSPKKLVEQGWKAVEGGDFNKAHGLFDRALQGGSGSDALYGRGYATEKLGDTVSATNDYCRALASGSTSVDMQREIEGSLRRLKAACP